MGKASDWVRRDGLLHIESCALLVIVLSLGLPVWAAALIGLAVGVGKEVWDRFHGGVPSWHDVFCDIIGVAVGSLVGWVAIAVNVYI